MSDDNSYFDQKVRGQVRAEMILDQNQHPILHTGGRLNHYKVRLYLDTSNPDVQQVIYKLDPTYYDPVRESNDATNQYQIELTTYGDYPVTVDVQVGRELVRKVVNLSTLLDETYAQSNNPDVQAALQAIKMN